MHPLIRELLAEAPVVTDGAWATRLMACGLPDGVHPDGWNLTHPDRVEEVARGYVAAGSRVILTNTFQANRLALSGSPLADQVEAINRAGVAISRRAAAGRAYVFASMGPSGKRLSAGEVSANELRAAFTQQAQALAAAGADGLVIETMCDLNEALAALAAARTTGLPVVVCITFGVEGGLAPEPAAEALTAAGADVIGTNCGWGIAGFAEICRRLRAATDRPTWLKPNAGAPQMVNGQLVFPTNAEDFAAQVPALVEAGAAFVGGCCGTTPEYIRAICRQLGRRQDAASGEAS